MLLDYTFLLIFIIVSTLLLLVIIICTEYIDPNLRFAIILSLEIMLFITITIPLFVFNIFISLLLFYILYTNFSENSSDLLSIEEINEIFDYDSDVSENDVQQKEDDIVKLVLIN